MEFYAACLKAQASNISARTEENIGSCFESWHLSARAHMESRVWEEAYTDFGAKRKEIEDWNLAHSGCCSWARFSGECVPGICRCLLTSPVFWSGPLWLCHPGSSSGMFFVRPLKWWNHIPNSEIELKERFGLAVFLPFPFQYLILSCLSSRTHMAFLLPRG